LEQKDKPELIIVVVQKEVAQRIVAQPPHMSILSLAIQFYSQVDAVFNINKSNFWPQPRVDSMVLKIKPNEFKIKKKLKTIWKGKMKRKIKKYLGISTQKKYEKSKIKTISKK